MFQSSGLRDNRASLQTQLTRPHLDQGKPFCHCYAAVTITTTTTIIILLIIIITIIIITITLTRRRAKEMDGHEKIETR